MSSNYIGAPLVEMRLDEIRRDVRASESTWSDLRQKYPPGKSCFGPLNFSVSSWSALASEDATGLVDDIDADETYSQAATMAAYGVDILSRALNGPTVDRELTEQANKLFATLCAALMDTRDRHRNSVTKAVSEKVGAFVCILDELNSPPHTGDTSSRMMNTEPEEQPIDTRVTPLLDKAEQLDVPMTPRSERRMSRSSARDMWRPHSRSRSRSPDCWRPQQLQNLDAARDNNLLRQRPDRHLPDIRLPTHYSAPKPAAPKHPVGGNSRMPSADGSDSRSVINHPTTAAYRSNGRTGPKLSRRTIIRTRSGDTACQNQRLPNTSTEKTHTPTKIVTNDGGAGSIGVKDKGRIPLKSRKII